MNDYSKLEKLFTDVDFQPLNEAVSAHLGIYVPMKFQITTKHGGQLYFEGISSNIVNHCGIFQAAIKDCFVSTFSAGVYLADLKDGSKPYPVISCSINLSYTSHGRGGNGMEIMRASFNRDNKGQWKFSFASDNKSNF